MTTIAYRDGVMAADSSTIFGNSIMFHNTHKVVRVETPTHIYLGGCAGGAALCAGFRQWLMDGMDENAYPQMQSPGEEGSNSGIVAVFDKATSEVELWQFEKDGAYVAYEEYIVDGSGSDFALAVMWHGGSAVEAIKAAVHFDTLTNGRVQTVNFGRAYLATLAPLALLPKRKRAKKAKNDNIASRENPALGDGPPHFRRNSSVKA